HLLGSYRPGDRTGRESEAPAAPAARGGDMVAGTSSAWAERDWDLAAMPPRPRTAGANNAREPGKEDRDDGRLRRIEFELRRPFDGPGPCARVRPLLLPLPEEASAPPHQ